MEKRFCINLHESIRIPFLAGMFLQNFLDYNEGGFFDEHGLILYDNRVTNIGCFNNTIKIKDKLSDNVISEIIQSDEIESVTIGRENDLIMFYDARSNNDLQDGSKVNISASILFANYNNMHGFYFEEGMFRTDCPFVGRVFVCSNKNVLSIQKEI